ncbi:MAG: GGDEF domain-containing protein [Dehalococcoidia bacterium]|nr:GGDEF domain-containing protein [Dehalococcoidia bacterium]
MSRPSDFSPPNALEVQGPAVATRSLSREVWVMRIIGGVLLVVAWAITTAHEFPRADFFLHSAVLVLLGAYAYIAAARARRIAVNLERRLRHGLLVHNMELANMAMQDDLTQLFNRRYFFDRLERELQTALGFERPLAVIVVDLDSMKSVNDTCGHRVGDQLLAAFGSFLLQQTRASDVAARIGGDEFAILLPDTSEQAAGVLMERIGRRLEATPLIEDANVSLRVSASFGLSGYPWSGSTADALMLQADAAMYAEKHLHKSAAGADGADGGANDAVAAGPSRPKQTNRR